MRAALILVAVAAGACAAAPAPKTSAASAGERAYQKCYSCHAVEPGKNQLTGPTLYRIVGRPVAAEPGFAYSPALKRFANQHPRWNPALLDRFAADPETLVPGTTMQFHGMSDPNERKALFDYLATLGEP